MKWLKVSLVVMAVMAVLLAAVIAGLILWGGPHDIGTIVIDDEVIDLHAAGGIEWLLAIGGILIATVVVLVVVPLALLLGLGLPALLAGLVLCLGLLLAGAALALVCSPLLVIALVVWWAVRKNKAQDAKMTQATPT